MKAIPRRLLVPGGGPASVDRAQTVRRPGGEVALVETAERVRAAPPIWFVSGHPGEDPAIFLLLHTPYCDSSAVPLTMSQLSRAERDQICDTRPMSRALGWSMLRSREAMRMPFLITTSGNLVPTNR